MKKAISLFLSLALFLSLGVSFAADTAASVSVKKDKSSLLKGIWHGKQSTVRMEAEGKVIYTDPVWLDNPVRDADLILVTHTHGDHFSLPDIKKLLKEDGMLVLPEDGVAAAKKEGLANVVSISPNKDYSANGIKFKAVPAYNLDKPFHTKSNKWVGYIVEANNANYYFAGDTDVLPEMKSFKADVAFLPVGGTYTMNAQEAIEAAKAINPAIAVPIHFADVVGTVDDAQAFIRGLDKGIIGAIMKDLLNGVTHITHSTIRIQSNKVIYFDPFQIGDKRNDADVIFISHSHNDHFSVTDIKKLVKKDTVLVVPGDCVKPAVDAGLTNIVTVWPSKSYEIDGLKFSTVPAYNVNKNFHKKESNWVGYIANINNASYYFAGDTDMIQEMKDIKANVIFLPVGGTYTMTSAEAVLAANAMNPLVAVPIHFGDIVGTAEDARNFVNGLNPSVKGVILK